MKKQIVTGLIGAASLLVMAATGAYALTGEVICASGNVTAVQAGYNEATWSKGCIATIHATCGTDATVKQYCVMDALYGDGMMAAALTALVEGKTVKYSTYPGWGDGLALYFQVNK